MCTFEEILRLVDEALCKLALPENPRGLYEPVEYVLALGGKRIRPSLFLMSANMYVDDLSAFVAPATAFEIFHNFTLLHDDLMDKADQRRGQATVHKKWNDNTAILSGDVMLVVAYQQLAHLDPAHLSKILPLFSTMAAEVCEGQQYDMEFESRMNVSQSEYLEMIRLKTAVLLGACLKGGAILADAPQEDADHLYDFGVSLGIAFQLMDDLLDVYGDPNTFGKKIGGDILCNKKTFLLINARNYLSVEIRNELDAWMNCNTCTPEEKIAAVTAIYTKIGVKKLCEEYMQIYYERALSSLAKVKVDEGRKKVLREVAENLMFRNR
ncbi:MAG: polyprenyl synthetase family protein [Bacteroidales bacterium]|nr:polyprenyl synthetase family protein [Bacteroidales bacterium]MDD4823475.1 polyprenyl synthetase family protein [Bacteroidales bacterium]